MTEEDALLMCLTFRILSNLLMLHCESNPDKIFMSSLVIILLRGVLSTRHADPIF